MTMTPRVDDTYVDGDEIVDSYWPYDGPFDDNRTAQAAVAVAQLVRYLNNGTGFHTGSALPYAASAYRVINGLWSAVAGLEQLLPQLVVFLERQVAASGLYDDRRDEGHPVAGTVQGAVDGLREAQGAVRVLSSRLREVAGHVGHLGNDPITTILVQAYVEATGVYETVDRSRGTRADFEEAELALADMGCEPGAVFRVVLVDDEGAELDAREVRAS